MNSVKGESFIKISTELPSEAGKVFCFIRYGTSPKLHKIPSVVIVKEVLSDESLSEFRVLQSPDVKYTCSLFIKGQRRSIDKMTIEN